MKQGIVKGSHANVNVTFLLSDNSRIPIEYVVDTGFAGFLTLPLAAAKQMQLMSRFDMRANLADDSDIEIPVYRATIVWNGQLRDVRVLPMGKRPLLGMALLEGNEINMKCIEQGAVTITELPSNTLNNGERS